MPPKRKNNNMLIPTIIMGILAVVLLYLGYRGGEGAHIAGLKSAYNMTIEIIPLLAFAFIIAGMIQTLVPHETVARWVGEESGFRGILIGSLAGGLTPGGPFVSLPIAAGLLRSGAGVGTMVAFITGWSLFAFSRLPMEVGVLGWKLTAIRFASTFIFPPIAGLIAHALFSGSR
jgi:uncharacterized membrane protein YraQ (UPF0718 family)